MTHADLSSSFSSASIGWTQNNEAAVIFVANLFTHFVVKILPKIYILVCWRSLNAINLLKFLFSRIKFQHSSIVQCKRSFWASYFEEELLFAARMNLGYEGHISGVNIVRKL